MDIIGFLPYSLNEWDGYISSIIWLKDCNWDCPYCYNKKRFYKNGKLISKCKIFDSFSKAPEWLDGVVITGGEPTIYNNELISFTDEIKQKTNLKIKLSTNGSNPKLIRELVNKKLIDCLSLDFKIYPFDKLKLFGNNVNVDDVKMSFDISLSTLIEKEFHTTLCPQIGINEEMIVDMALYLNNTGKWFLQQYINKENLDALLNESRVFSESKLSELYKEAQRFHSCVKLLS